MAINRTSFFANIRERQFANRLSQTQVDGMSDVLDVWDRKYSDKPNEWLAYILATVFHETGGKMIPVREGFSSNDSGARKAVQKLYNAGRIKTNYALPVNGVSYYGRGRVQNTWGYNYKKLEDRFGYEFTKKPDLLLDSKIDAEVTVTGHIEGIWTHRKLSQYFSESVCDPVGARQIINGRDKAELIAGYFQNILQAIEISEQTPESQSPIEVDGKSASKSTTVIASVGVGAAGTAQAITASLQPINDLISTTQTTLSAFTSLLTQPKILLPILLGCAIIFGAVWIIKERMKHSKENGV